MKQGRRVDQWQNVLFDELSPNDGPSLLEVRVDRNPELEAAVGELLLKAAGKVERGSGGDRDA